VDFQTLRLEKDGQVFYQFDSRVEGDLSQTLSENGGNGKAFWVVDSQDRNQEVRYDNAIYPDPKRVGAMWRHRVYCVPISYEISEILTERKMEHTPNYAGINLSVFGSITYSQHQMTHQAQLELKSQSQDQLLQSQDAVVTRNPGTAGSPPLAAPANYKLHVTYVRNAIMETTGQSVKLITCVKLIT
jgi:hypothetical protein